jgi:hypothetical protein
VNSKPCDRWRQLAFLVATVILLFNSFAGGRSVDYGGYRPHYQGYGVNTPAGRGGAVCRVTSLSDSVLPPQPGTLRYCVEASTGPRFVVFEISGTIQLMQGPLFVRHPFVTIAGQSAPSPGILIRGPGVIVDTHDVVMQHIRVRVGAVSDEPHGIWLRDDARNVVIDHVSVSWAVWTSVAVAAFTPGHPPGDISILDSIIAEPLACSGVNDLVPCNPRFYPATGSSNSRALRIGDNWDHPVPYTVSLLRNIFANGNDRLPEIDGRTQTFLVNNLIYNPSQAPSSAIYMVDVIGSGAIVSVVTGNVLVPGPTTPGRNGYVPSEYPEEGEVWMVRVDPTVADSSRIYLDGNFYEAHCNGLACLAGPAAQWMLARDFKMEWFGISVRASAPPLQLANLPLSSALPRTIVESHLKANAGARPMDRDAVDARIIREITTRTGRVPNSPADQAGTGTAPDGFPILAENRRPLPLPSNPHAVIDSVGRTRIEAWLETLARQLEPAN